MARGRMLSIDVAGDPHLNRLSLEAHLLYVQTIPHLDRDGLVSGHPLLLWAKRGIAPNAWYRGNLEGIAPEDLVPLLSLKDKLSFTVMGHVTVPAKLQQKAIAGEGHGGFPQAARASGGIDSGYLHTP